MYETWLCDLDDDYKNSCTEIDRAALYIEEINFKKGEVLSIVLLFEKQQLVSDFSIKVLYSG